jgi:glyoxylase-like metal-dependent hydrolase (beta-lactamase superfamily II)
VCLYVSELGCVFTGDTLFHGGPGATGRSYSDRPTLEASIRAKLFALPDETVVHTGHGEDTTIGSERARGFWAAGSEPVGDRHRLRTCQPMYLSADAVRTTRDRPAGTNVGA